MGYSRRAAAASLFASAVASALAPRATGQIPVEPPGEDQHTPGTPNPDEDKKLPNGKSQKDAIAQQEHAEALKEADRLVELANDVKNELEKAGNFIVPLSTLHKTEEIEKLARKIRGRLKN
jgi:hypothetical protein